MPLRVNQKTMKYLRISLGINLTKYVQDVYTVTETEQQRHPGHNSHIHIFFRKS